MSKELKFWQFISDRLDRDLNVMLLIVAESFGSSPGRAGYRMAVAADGELCGSIGGGVMEVSLVEESRTLLSEPGATATGFREQVHQKNSPHASGMICSGRQTVILTRLTANDAQAVRSIVESITQQLPAAFEISKLKFQILRNSSNNSRRSFTRSTEADFVYQEKLGSADQLYIIGGGHCALALSELMSKLDFHITILDDRQDLNTIEKNDFADDISIIEDYTTVNDRISDQDDLYVVVMTLGYASDKVVIKQLAGRDFKYFGVLGSKAKMATLMKELKAEGIDSQWLARIHTPIGIPINSRTPEEIAVSIAAEIISVRNSA